VDRRTFCPSGPFRSGQDNQEPIYDNSHVKIGADVGDPGTVSMQDTEEGHSYGKKKQDYKEECSVTWTLR
jgi:hypothetical protein